MCETKREEAKGESECGGLCECACVCEMRGNSAAGSPLFVLPGCNRIIIV